MTFDQFAAFLVGAFRLISNRTGSVLFESASSFTAVFGDYPPDLAAAPVVAVYAQDSRTVIELDMEVQNGTR